MATTYESRITDKLTTYTAETTIETDDAVGDVDAWIVANFDKIFASTGILPPGTYVSHQIISQKSINGLNVYKTEIVFTG